MDHIRKIWQLEEEEGYWSERGQLAADATWIAAAHEEYVTVHKLFMPQAGSTANKLISIPLQRRCHAIVGSIGTGMVLVRDWQ